MTDKVLVARNPVYEPTGMYSTIENNPSTLLSKNAAPTKAKKLSGRVPIIIAVTIVIGIVALIGIVAMVVFRPTATTSENDVTQIASSVEMAFMTVEIQRLLDEMANQTRIELLNTMNEAIQNYQYELQKSNSTIHVTINEMQLQQNDILTEIHTLRELDQTLSDRSDRAHNITERLKRDVEILSADIIDLQQADTNFNLISNESIQQIQSRLSSIDAIIQGVQQQQNEIEIKQNHVNQSLYTELTDILSSKQELEENLAGTLDNITNKLSSQIETLSFNFKMLNTSTIQLKIQQDNIQDNIIAVQVMLNDSVKSVLPSDQLENITDITSMLFSMLNASTGSQLAALYEHIQEVEGRMNTLNVILSTDIAMLKANESARLVYEDVVFGRLENITYITNKHNSFIGMLNASTSSELSILREYIQEIEMKANNSVTTLNNDVATFISSTGSQLTSLEENIQAVDMKANLSISTLEDSITDLNVSTNYQFSTLQEDIRDKINIVQLMLNESVRSVQEEFLTGHLQNHSKVTEILIAMLNSSTKFQLTSLQENIQATNVSISTLEDSIADLNVSTNYQFSTLQEDIRDKINVVRLMFNESVRSVQEEFLTGRLQNHSEVTEILIAMLNSSTSSQLTSLQEHIQEVETKANDSILTLKYDIVMLNTSTRSQLSDFEEQIEDVEITANNFLNKSVIFVQENVRTFELKINNSINSINNDFLSFMLHTNNTNDGLKSEISRVSANLTNEFNKDLESIKTILGQLKLNNTNSSLVFVLNSSERGLFCESLTPPSNGSIRTEAGPNSHINGLDSMVTYSCDSGYSLVGGATRTCRDINGGTVITGTWSGIPPTCQEILCTQLTSPINGVVTINSEVYSTGVVANYTCHSGYILVGDEMRTCEEDSGTVGTWTGRTPHCQRIITCSSLSTPSNGDISVSSGAHEVSLGVGAVATFSCNTGYGLIGSARRTCETVSGESVHGAWSGSQPFCQEILTCPSLSPLMNGTMVFTPGADNSIIGLGSVVTYSCNLGYVLVGGTTRVCQSLHGEASAAWSGNPPICDEAVYCPALIAPGNGSVTISSGFNPLSVGSVASYSCDSGYALLGPSTRTCVDPDQDSVGTWTGDNVECPQILCPELAAPDNGTVIMSSVNLGVGVTATFSCDPGLVLVGEVTRTCEEQNGDTVGAWSGRDTTCAIPNRAMIDCQDTDCRHEQLVCPEQDNCTVDCYDSRQYACYQTDVFCPSRSGDCTVNCDDSYACLQANTTCPQGDCTVNCQNSYTCLNSVVRCSGDSCLLNCEGENSCTDIVVEGTSGNYTMNCNGRSTCQDSSVVCPPNGICNLDCLGGSACQDLSVVCPSNGICNLDCGYSACQDSSVVCPLNGSCSLNCLGYSACLRTNIKCPIIGECSIDCSAYRFACTQLKLTCPEEGDCDIDCSVDYACARLKLTCPEEGDCDVDCSGINTCQNTEFNCSAEGHCSIHCENRQSCENTRLLCPSGGQCDFIFIEPTEYYSGSDNTGRNAVIHCEENSSCSIQCRATRYSPCFNSRITCPRDTGNCNVECGYGSCQYSAIDCGVSGDCLTCSGSSSCRGATITYVDNIVASLTCSGTSSCISSNIRCPLNETCNIGCFGLRACQSANIACGKGEDCLTCSGSSSCNNAIITYPINEPATLNCNGAYSCQSSRITCPQNDCTINCTNDNACQRTQIICPSNSPCVTSCTDDNTCQSATITCPTNDSCTVNCDALNSCNDATVTCPTGDHSCNILCTDPLSCSNLMITNTHLLNLQCCGDLSCMGTNVIPTSYACPYIQ